MDSKINLQDEKRLSRLPERGLCRYNFAAGWDIYGKERALEHGAFSARRCGGDSAENYLRWLHCGGDGYRSLCRRRRRRWMTALQGAHFTDCACSLPASAALMTTNRCNMGCPVCFTRDKKEGLHEPDLAECEKPAAALQGRRRGRRGGGAVRR